MRTILLIPLGFLSLAGCVVETPVPRTTTTYVTPAPTTTYVAPAPSIVYPSPGYAAPSTVYTSPY